MKHFCTYFFILLGCVLFISCSKNSSTDILDISDDVVSMLISNDSAYQAHKINEALSGDYKKYMEFFEGTDYEIGISTSKDGALPDGIEISTQNISRTKSSNSIMDSFGKVVKFSFCNESQTKSSNSNT